MEDEQNCVHALARRRRAVVRYNRKRNHKGKRCEGT
jgi:hypothetical protein